MTIKDLYAIMYAEQQCSLFKTRCDRNCNECSFYIRPSDSNEAYRRVLEDLRDRNTELLFVDSIELLRSYLEGGEGH